MVFFLISVLAFYKSYQSVDAADEKELSFLLEQERSFLDQRFISYKMTLESVSSLIHKSIRNKEKIDEEDLKSVTMALISSQPYVYSLFYALEPKYAKNLKDKEYYIYALLKDFNLIGSEEFSEKKNIQRNEYFDGDYYNNAKGSNQNWYHAAKNEKSIFLTEPYFDSSYLKFTMFSVVLPLKGENDEFAGIVGLDIPLAVLSIENAKRTSSLHYRTLIVDKNGRALENLIEESDFKYPKSYLDEDVFKFDAKSTKITQSGKFKIKDKKGNSYLALSAPIFNNEFKLVVIKSKKVVAILSGFYRDMLIALLALLPLQFFLTKNVSDNIYRNIKRLFNNFKNNTEKIKISRDVFTPVHLDRPLEYLELDELRQMWESVLDEFYKALQEVKVEKDKSLKSLEFQSQFLANMSHEIRTPMNAIVGMVELLKETDLTPKQKDILKIFSSSSDNLLALLNDIIDLVKIESGNMRIEYVKTRLEKIKEDTLMVYKEKANNKNLDFSFEIDKNVNPKVITDPIRLKQIIFNLVGNAIKFTEQGRVGVLVKNHSEDPDKIIFVVRDTGVGIAKNKTKYIFKKFAQADISTTRKYGGSGLGLSIVKSLLRLMDGTINLKTQEGLGSEFVVTLPIKYYEEDKKTEPQPHIKNQFVKANLNEKTNFDDQRSKILIADDVFENRVLLSMYAKFLGVNCDLVENGEQAVSAAKTQAYDLIILDIQMPIMDGLQAYKEIRSLSNDNSMIPIVAFSAYASKTDEEKYLSEGFSAYLTKPLTKETFVTCLSKYL